MPFLLTPEEMDFIKEILGGAAFFFIVMFFIWMFYKR